MEKKQIIPDWSAQSLWAAYKWFCSYTPWEFMEKAIIDDGTGKWFWYSHAEEVPPIFGPGFNPELETAEKT